MLSNHQYFEVLNNTQWSIRSLYWLWSNSIAGKRICLRKQSVRENKDFHRTDISYVFLYYRPCVSTNVWVYAICMCTCTPVTDVHHACPSCHFRVPALNETTLAQTKEDSFYKFQQLSLQVFYGNDGEFRESEAGRMGFGCALRDIWG